MLFFNTAIAQKIEKQDFNITPDGVLENVLEYISEPEIDMNFKSLIKVYPNPSSDLFNIDLTQEEQKYTSITIYNVLGTIVFSTTIIPNQINSIDLSSLSKGYYFAKLKDSNNNQTTLKLIKN